MMKIACLLVALVLMCAVSAAQGGAFLYVNHAPDVRYSQNNIDARISFVTEKDLFGYGNYYGKTSGCTQDSRKCMQFDFMALHALPDNASVGYGHSEGEYVFTVSREVHLSIINAKYQALRVDVSKSGKWTNSYLWDASIGVMAIIVPNFENAEIPESIFFLDGPLGIYSRSDGLHVDDGG